MSEKYRCAESVVTRQILGETLLVPIRGHLADLRNLYVLNRVGEYIWQRLDGRHTLQAIRADMVRTFETSDAQVDADLRAFVDQLEAAGLVARAD